jgi:two-component system sensor histidine kinase/response regulator
MPTGVLKGKEKVMPKKPSQQDEKLNRASILERLEGNQDLLTELVQLFQVEAPQLIEAMHKALRQGDMQELGRSAHTLKGAAGYFLAHGTVSVAKQLEIDSNNGDAESAKATFARLEVLVERLLTELVELSQEVTK